VDAPPVTPVESTVAGTVAPSTAVPATTVSAVATAVTAAPTTSVAVDRTALEEIVKRAAIRQILVDDRECLANPIQCNVEAITSAVGPARANLLAVVKERQHLGWLSKTNISDPSYLVVTSVLVAPDGRSAAVEACFWNTNIVYEPNAAPDGSDIIVDETKETDAVHLVMLPVGGVWRLTDGTRTIRAEGRNLCDAQP
jgi:hypothetical protein